MEIEVLADHRPQATPEDLEKAAKIRSILHDGQRLAADDEASKKSTVAGRRGGKTFGEAGDLIIHGLENPLANNLFVTLAKSHARTLLWDNPKTGLRVLNKMFKLGMHMDNTKAIATLPNGSLISLHGATKADELEKIRGRANDRVKVDECASFAPKRLENLVDKCIYPSLADYNGRLTLCGTPGPVCAGPWWESTSIHIYGDNPFKNEKPKCISYHDRMGRPMTDEFEWSCHRYTFEDNVAIPSLREFAYAEKRRKQWDDDDPIWLNEWMGLWVLDFASLTYRYKPDYDWAGGKIPVKANWKYVASVFWGKTGTAGVVVLAYSETTHGVWHVAERRIKDATLRKVAATLRGFEQKFPFDEIIGARHGNKGKIFDDMAEFHGIYINPVDLKVKPDLIVLANEDIDAGRMRALADSELRSEMLRIQWSDPGVKEDTTYTSNEISTAFLIAWQFCYHRGPRKVTTKGPKKGTREHDELIAERELRELEARVARDEGDWLENELGDIDSTAIFDHDQNY
jgi:hypothetical protein